MTNWKFAFCIDTISDAAQLHRLSFALSKHEMLLNHFFSKQTFSYWFGNISNKSYFMLGERSRNPDDKSCWILGVVNISPLKKAIKIKIQSIRSTVVWHIQSATWLQCRKAKKRNSVKRGREIMGENCSLAWITDESFSHPFEIEQFNVYLNSCNFVRDFFKKWIRDGL